MTPQRNNVRQSTAKRTIAVGFTTAVLAAMFVAAPHAVGAAELPSLSWSSCTDVPATSVPTGGPIPLTLAAFPTSLGHPDVASISVDTLGSATVVLENTKPAPAGASSYVSLLTTISSTLLTGTGTAQMSGTAVAAQWLDAFDSTVDGQGPSGATLTDRTVHSMVIGGITNPDLVTASGGVPLTVNFAYSTTPGGGTVATATGTAAAQVCLDVVYHVPTVAPTGYSTVEYCASLPMRQGSTSNRPLSVPQFDPALGTLIDATYDVTLATRQRLMLENSDGIPVDAQWTLTSNAFADGGPLGTTGLAVTVSEGTTYSLPPSDGILDYDGTSGRTLPFAGYQRHNTLALPPAGLTGTVTVLVDAGGVSSLEVNSGNFDQVVRGWYGAAACITYRYRAAAVAGLAGLGDHTWIDANGNGTQDSGELPLADVRVTVWSGSTSVATALTDSNGHWYVDGLTPGTYSVTFSLPAGYNFTGATVGADRGVDSDADTSSGATGSITLAADEVNLSVDAGYVLAPTPTTTTATTQPTTTTAAPTTTTAAAPTTTGVDNSTLAAGSLRNGPAALALTGNDTAPLATGATIATAVGALLLLRRRRHLTGRNVANR